MHETYSKMNGRAHINVNITKNTVISKYREKALRHIHEKNTQGLQSDKGIYEKPGS